MSKNDARKAEAKKYILANNKEFGGPLDDTATIVQCGIAHNTFYRYKFELRHELQTGQITLRDDKELSSAE